MRFGHTRRFSLVEDSIFFNEKWNFYLQRIRCIIHTNTMEMLTFTPAPLETLRIAVKDKWPHKIIGQIALDAEEAGTPIELINEILQSVRKTK